MSHNTFGSIFKFTTWGESHGKAIGCVVDGTPPMIELLEKDIQLWLDKRLSLIHISEPTRRS